MPDIRNLLSGRRNYIGGLFLLLIMSVIFLAFSMGENEDFALSKREILLRRIGHEVLLQAGDSTSRVLPVKKLSDNEYQISFENKFTFQPGSLVNITQQVLAKDPLAKDYVVNVINCEDEGIAYGYAVSQNWKDDIISCKGRKQPVACYLINIKFKPAGIVTARNGYLVSSLTALAFVGFFFLRPFKSQRKPISNQPAGMFTIGSMLFDAGNRKLIVNGNATDLTRTEARVLSIFASSPNETIERSRLQKEIWEDEGVIVGRSLDMFISKLRKKLELDPDVKIVVIRGKGYKLEV